MKKAILLLFILLVSFGITSCRPEGVSKDYYTYGLKALETIDQYLAAEIELEETHDKLEGLSDRFSDNEDLSSEDFSIKLYIDLLESYSGYLYDGVDKLKELRDDLAKNLGEKQKYNNKEE